MSVRMRHTSSHTKNRRSHHALAGKTIITDKESGNLRLPHRLDESTGTYRGIQIISKKELKAEQQKEEKKAARKREHVHAEGTNQPIHTEKHLAADASEVQSQGIHENPAHDRTRARSGTA